MGSGAGPREGEIRLDDGRTLAYAEWGDPDGGPGLGCHGSPSSRLERHVEDPETYRRWGVRLVVPDRPGFGRSDPSPGRRVLDWPGDVAQLLEQLGIARLAVLSLSGGAAYALACAHVLGDRGHGGGILGGAPSALACAPPRGPRVHAVGILGGPPPPDVPWPWPRWVPDRVRRIAHRPTPARLLQPGFAPAAPPPAMTPRYLQVRLNPADRRVIGRPRLREVLATTFTE